MSLIYPPSQYFGFDFETLLLITLTSNPSCLKVWEFDGIGFGLGPGLDNWEWDWE